MFVLNRSERKTVKGVGPKDGADRPIEWFRRLHASVDWSVQQPVNWNDDRIFFNRSRDDVPRLSSGMRFGYAPFKGAAGRAKRRRGISAGDTAIAAECRVAHAGGPWPGGLLPRDCHDLPDR